MFDAREAKRLTRNRIKTRYHDVMKLAEKKVSEATERGNWRTTVAPTELGSQRFPNEDWEKAATALQQLGFETSLYYEQTLNKVESLHISWERNDDE